jgi:glycosyltransferase involved in cell wall biosynthesis
MAAIETSLPTRPIFFTIVSANYLAYARALMRSVREHHPDAARYVFLADEPVETAANDDLFKLVPAREIGVPNYDHLAFRYSILEFNTALKPIAFRWLLAEHETAPIVYLDPDIVVLSPLEAVLDAMDSGALAVLTPHLDHPLNDGKHPDESTFLRVGIYNLGFIAVGQHPSRQALVDWWADRLEFGAFVDLEAGTFTDQKWIDLVPGLFPDVRILRHPGYNLAYWNLAIRSVTTASDGTLRARGEPVAFVHFSGADLGRPGDFSKYQNRFDTASIGALRPVYEKYLAALRTEGHEELAKSRYAYEQLRDGSAITPEMRSLFRYRFDIGRPQEQEAPFGLTAKDFANAAPISARLTRRALEAYRAGRRRPYVRLVMDRLAPRARLMLRRRVLRAATPPSVRVEQDLARASEIGYPLSRPTGLELVPRANLIGYFEGEFGVAEAARQLARAAETAGVEMARIRVDAGRKSSQRDRSMSDSFTSEPQHPVNIICVNADQTELVAAGLGGRVLENRYNIGFWFWELARFPDAWNGAIDLVDEVWVATDFVREAIAAKTNKPVRTIGVAVDATPSRAYTKAEFNLAPDRFTFLFSFDFASYPARKNPSAVIEAFRLAFPSGTEPVNLFLKSINGHRNPVEMAKLSEVAAEDSRIRLQDGFLTRDEVFGLESVADCYVSLHRSEGFGLGLAESMSLGKPVIGTAYSGNLDFMNASNSCLVGYRLVDVKSNEYPHHDGQVWADPDIQQAAYFMARLLEDAAFRSHLGQVARRDMARVASTMAVGVRAAAELTRIASDRAATKGRLRRD